MGDLRKSRGHELLSFDYQNVATDSDGTLMLSSLNRNPDPLFSTVSEDGRMLYWNLGKPPRPDGWGVFVKGPNETQEFSEQNGYPLPLGKQPYYDLAQPVVKGAPLPERDEQVAVTQPEAPRAVIFLTADKAFPTGYYCAAHAFRMAQNERVTTPDPSVAGAPSSRTEAFQMSATLGRAFYIPPAARGASEIVIYLTPACATANDAVNARLFQQFVIPIEDNRQNTIEFRGPLKLDVQAARENKTKLESFGGPGGFKSDRVTRGNRKNKHYYVQFAYELLDDTGHSKAAYSDVKEVLAERKQGFNFKPNGDSLWDVARRAVTGWKAYVRYKTFNNGNWNWSGWKRVKEKNSDMLRMNEHAKVGHPGESVDGFSMSKGSPSDKDTTGLGNPTEPMTMLDTALVLNSNGLTNGKHRIKTVLYVGDRPSEPSPTSVVDISASNQTPRIYQPFYTNRLDNPDMIDTNSSTNRPRDWTFNRDSRTTYQRGKLTVDETDGQTTRGDLIVTPYGYIDRSELRYGARVIVEVAKHVSGKAVDVLLEYNITSYNSNGSPNVSFLKQSTLGVHRRNGQYTLGYKIRNGTKERDAIQLENNTDLVVIKTIGDGTDANLGVRNYKVFRKGHGIFRGSTPNKRKFDEKMDKIDWFEFDDDAYPHGGYCRVISSGEDATMTGITGNGTDTGISIPTSTALTGTSLTEKTIEVRFQTGENITSEQVVYKQGDNVNGYALIINSGSLHFRAWQGTTNVASATYTVRKHEKYIASLVRTATGLVCYIDGEQVATSATALAAFSSGGTASAGYNNGTVKNTAGTSVTTPLTLQGRIFEVRVWNRIRTASEILDKAFKQFSNVDAKLLVLYLKLHELEGSTTYDVSGNSAGASIVGDFRWLNTVPDASWRGAYGIIDNMNFKDNVLPSPWSMSGAATSTIGNFSAHRMSKYGQRQTGTGTNLRYATRTIPGGYTRLSLGAQKRFITLPTGGDITLLQAADGTGDVMEMKVTADKQLQVRALGGTWNTVERGIEPGERLYFEMRAEGLGTASGIVRAFVGANDEEELTQTAIITGLNFTGRNVTTVRAGNCAVSASITNTWDFHMGQVVVSTDGKVKKHYIPGNYIEYFGPEDTPVEEEYGPTGLEIPVTPGETATHSVYAMCEELSDNNKEALQASFYDENGNLLESLPYLVQFPDNEQDWQRYTQTFVVPDGAANLVYDANNIGEGLYRIQALQVQKGGSVSAFTAMRELTGYVRVKFDTITQGTIGTPVEGLGAVKNILSADFDGEYPEGTSISLQIASASTLNGVYTGYYSDIANVPINRWYEIKATLTTTDRLITPTLTNLSLRVERKFPTLLGPNGGEYKGATLLNNMSAPTPRRLVEVTQMDDGSNGFTTWGVKPIRWIEGGELVAFRESTVADITENVGKGQSIFMYEYLGMLYTVRIVEPIEFEPTRANHVPLPNEDEDFYVFRATLPRAEVIDSQEI